MDHEDKQVWTAKADEVKRQLHAYNAALAQKGLTGDNNKDMRKYKKGIALPKGPR